MICSLFGLILHEPQKSPSFYRIAFKSIQLIVVCVCVLEKTKTRERNSPIENRDVQPNPLSFLYSLSRHFRVRFYIRSYVNDLAFLFLFRLFFLPAQITNGLFFMYFWLSFCFYPCLIHSDVCVLYLPSVSV